MAHSEKMKGFAELLTVSEFLSRLFKTLPAESLHNTETCDLTQAHGKVLAEDITCPFDLPSFDRSAVDGYAVRAIETIGASPTNPIELRIAAKIVAGDRPDKLSRLAEGEAMTIFTGAPIPLGADSVVMLENCDRTDDVVYVRRPVRSTQNVSRRGEDYQMNEIIVKSGTILRPWHVGAVASIGRSTVRVFKAPWIGVLSTGSEVVEPGVPVRPGQVANSTKPMLLSFVKEGGGHPVDLGTVPDDLGIIRESISKGLDDCDIILTTGGSSVGERDLVMEAISGLQGYKFVAHGVRLRPGRPTGVSVVQDNKIIFVLSGFPVAAMAAYEALVKPTMRHLVHAESVPEPRVRGTLRRRVSNETGNKSFVRVKVTRGPRGLLDVEPLMLTGSGLLSTLTRGNALLIVDEDIEGYDEGEEVEVFLTGPIDVRSD